LEVSTTRSHERWMRLALVIASSLFANACTGDDNSAAPLPPGNDAPTVGATCDPEARFGPILDKSCLGCHSVPVGGQGSYTAKARAPWSKDVEWKRVLESIQAKRMPPPGSPPLSDSDVAAAGACGAAAPLCATTLPKHAAMISRDYYMNALQEIFPPEIATASAPLLDSLAQTDKKADFRTITTGGGYTTVSVALQVGWDIAFKSLGTDSAVDTLDACLGAYATAPPADQQACIDRVLGRYARLILRQTPSADDLTKVKSEFAAGATGADHREGVRYALAYLLQRPEFLYHLESGLAEAGRLGQERILSKLSRYLWGGPPNDALLDWAKGTDLGTPADREKLARRMLDDPRAKRSLTSFYGQLLRVDDEVALTTNAAVLDGAVTANLRDDARTELLSYVEHQVFTKNGTFKDLFTASDAVVPSANLALIYGLSPTAVGKPTPVPDRKGILARAAMLLSRGDSPNIFHFGAMVAQNVLCESIPPPDPAAVAQAAKIDIPPTATARERATIQTGSGVCVGCHGRFNPYGFARLGFSAIGRRVDTEKIFDAEGKLVREAPVDTHTEIPVDGTTVTVANLDEASAVLGKSHAVARCFVSKFLSFTDGRRVDPQDKCFTERVGAQIADGSLSVKEALVRVISSSEFVTTGAEP
jgi:cytochrome c5